MPASLVASLAFSLLASGAAAQQRTPDDAVFTPREIAAARSDPKYFTLDPATIEIVKVGDIKTLGGEISLPKPPGTPGGSLPLPPIGPDPIVIIDRIINIAERLWRIIEDNKPTVDIKTTYATAVPDGITHWTQLQQWKPPEGTEYSMSAKNMYGVKVVDVKYVVFRTCGGNWKGKGKYLTGVTLQPTKVSVSWGYKFSMAAEVPSVANVGTNEDPIGSMMAKINWSIESALRTEQGSAFYYAQGDGLFRELAGPSSKASTTRVRKLLDAAPAMRGVAPLYAPAERLKALGAAGF